MNRIAKISFVLFLLAPAMDYAQQESVDFQDEPALTTKERWALKGARAVGTAGGAVVGIAAGGYVGWLPIKNKKELVTLDDNVQLGSPRWQKFLGVGEKQRQKAISSISGGATVGWISGSAAGYYAGDQLANRLLAKRHGISYRVEKISRYYDINVEQYRPILVAAEKKDRDLLRAVVIEFFNKRFGADWANSMSRFFNEFHNYAHYLLGIKKELMSKKEQDFLRMVQLGAVMSNIYYNTSPAKKNTVNSAVTMYQFLGLMQ